MKPGWLAAEAIVPAETFNCSENPQLQTSALDTHKNLCVPFFSNNLSCVETFFEPWSFLTLAFMQPPLLMSEGRKAHRSAPLDRRGQRSRPRDAVTTAIGCRHGSFQSASFGEYSSSGREYLWVWVFFSLLVVYLCSYAFPPIVSSHVTYILWRLVRRTFLLQP